MNQQLANLNAVKEHLAAAWLMLDKVEVPPEESNLRDYAKHAKSKLCTALNNIEVLRVNAGATRDKFEPGNVVLLTVECETGVVQYADGCDCCRVKYGKNGNFWVRASWCQMVKLRDA